MGINYYVLDTETTGLKAGFHEINQISLIRISDGFQKSFHVAVEFPQNASPQALEIQGITKADLKRGVKMAEAIKELNAFMAEDGLNAQSRCIVGHNVAFDKRFSQAAWEKDGKQFPADLWLCTKKFYGEYVKKVGEETVKKLQANSGLVGPAEKKVKYGQDLCLIGAGLTPKKGAHSAAVDAMNCNTLYSFLMTQKLNHVRVIDNAPHRVKTGAPEIFYDFD